MMASLGGSARKQYLFQASGIWKGRDFTGWSIYRGREICHLGLWKSSISKGLTDEFYGSIKWGKLFFLWLIAIKKTVHLQQLKGMQSSKLGMWKGYHLSIEGITKAVISAFLISCSPGVISPSWCLRGVSIAGTAWRNVMSLFLRQLSHTKCIKTFFSYLCKV